MWPRPRRAEPETTSSERSRSRATGGSFHGSSARASSPCFPKLSYALGVAGATGRNFRPSLALHAMGLAAGEILGLTRPTRGLYRYKLPGIITRWRDPRAFFDRIGNDGSEGCWGGPDEGPNLDRLPPCPAGCEAYPNRDEDCFGMCGPGCQTCWEWICGDCCYHDFCATHDSLLRACDGVADAPACVASVLVTTTYILGCDPFFW